MLPTFLCLKKVQIAFGLCLKVPFRSKQEKLSKQFSFSGFRKLSGRVLFSEVFGQICMEAIL